MESVVPVTDSPGTSLEQRNVAHRNKISPKFNLAKVKNKYLILDILIFSGNRDEVSELLWGTDRAMRSLLIQQFNFFML